MRAPPTSAAQRGATGASDRETKKSEGRVYPRKGARDAKKDGASELCLHCSTTGMGTLTRLGGLDRTERSSTDGLQDFHRWGPGQDTISCPSPDRKRAGPGLAAKRRKRRKKDEASELALPGSSDTDDSTEAGPQFCSVGRIGPSPPHLFESARIHSHSLLITPAVHGSRTFHVTPWGVRCPITRVPQFATQVPEASP